MYYPNISDERYQYIALLQYIVTSCQLHYMNGDWVTFKPGAPA